MKDCFDEFENIRQVPCKTLVAKVNGEGWFDISYNMNIYRGCTHGCIYCDSRSDCYKDKAFDEVKVKRNALQVIEKDLARLRNKGIVATGSMSDPYNPLEEKLMLTAGSLKLIDKYKFGVSVITKSPLVARDIELFQNVSRHSPVIVKITITTADDGLVKKIEQNAASSSQRFKAIKQLSDNGIFCGVMMMPILPFINDNEGNVRNVVRLAKENGAMFVFPSFGVTLRDGQREYFYDRLEENFPKLKREYQKTYANSYSCSSPYAKELYLAFKDECAKLGLMHKMQDIISFSRGKYDNTKQLNLFDLLK